jgi:uncharacterized protein YdeI (YjbR/CyaY-like superfamily)
MKPKFFKNQQEFRKWLEKNHRTKSELIVGYYKVGSGKPSMTWSQSVDEALCFGWIDGVRKSINKNSYQIRFTPRRSTSIWSAINIKKIKELTKKRLMRPAGLVSFKNRKKSRSEVYTYETKELEFSPVFEKQFKTNKMAWKYFLSLTPGYRKLSKNWVMGAKLEATQLKRLALLIKYSEAGTNPWKENKYNKK